MTGILPVGGEARLATGIKNISPRRPKRTQGCVLYFAPPRLPGTHAGFWNVFDKYLFFPNIRLFYTFSVRVFITFTGDNICTRKMTAGRLNVTELC